MAVVHLAITPAIGVRAIKQYFRTRRRLRAERGTGAADLFHFVNVTLVGPGGEEALGDGISPTVAGVRKEDDRAVTPAFDFRLCRFVPTRSGQSAFVDDRPKLVVSECDDLRATPVVG